MSGWISEPGVYDLTWTKCMKWHANRRGCPCSDHHEVYRVHLEPEGFVVEDGPSEALLRLRGPGLSVGDSGPLWEAVTGRTSAFEGPPPWDRPKWMR